MLTQNRTQLKVGTWIKGTSKNGELIIGYIEDVDSTREIVNVTVVNSDNNEIIGKKVKMLNKWVKQLPVSSDKNEKQLRSLIDLALATRDEVWFNELSAKLNLITSKTNHSFLS